VSIDSRRLTELDPEVAEEFEGFDEMPRRSAEPVERRHGHHVDPPGLYLRHETIEGGPPLLGPRHALVDELGGLPAPGRHVFPEVAELGVTALVAGAHPGVYRDPGAGGASTSSRGTVRRRLHATDHLRISVK